MTTASVPLPRPLTAELLGSAFLAALVTRSGIAAQHLPPGQTGPEFPAKTTSSRLRPPPRTTAHCRAR